MTMTAIDVHIALTKGDLDLDARLTAGPGDVVALVGPNGSGKSTLLRAIAAQTNAGLVFQDRLLFPTMTALDNVAFGLRGLGRKESRRQAAEWLAKLSLTDVAHLRPAALSGGQAQRVALARALAREPTTLLLDEPFAGVDVAARVDVRRAVRQAAEEPGRVTVLVTHEPIDVLNLATKVVVLEGGRVTQAGTVDEVRTRPRSPWAARMAGVNLLPADRVTATAAGTGDFAVIHPRAVTLSRERPTTSARNAWHGRVTDIDLEGDRVRVRLAGDVDLVAEITPAALAELAVREGVELWASVKATEVDVYT